MPSLLVVDEPRERVEGWRAELEAAGYGVSVLSSDDDGLRERAVAPDVMVLAATTAKRRAWKALEQLRSAESHLGHVPVVAIVGAGALEDGLRAAIEGAVRCLAEPVEGHALVATLDAVLAADAPSPVEQRRLARRRALAMLARIESRGAASDDDDLHPRLVHLTRLEHGPARSEVPQQLADARRRLGMLTTKQRGLLHLVEAEGSVTAVATRLGTSRGNVYAGLRRIVHRLGVRDTGELLRIVAGGDLLQSQR